MVQENRDQELKNKIKKYIQRLEELEEKWGEKKRFDYLYSRRNNVNYHDFSLWKSFLKKKWVNIISGKILLTKEGKKILNEVKNFSKVKSNLIEKIKECLKKASVFEVDWSESYDRIVIFGEVIISLRNKCIYKDFFYSKVCDLSDGEMFEILYKKKLKGCAYEKRDVNSYIETLLK